MNEMLLCSRGIEPIPPPFATLPLPSELDSLETLTAKLSSFLYVIHAGRCVAAATGHAAYGSEQPTAEARAKSQMKPHEQEYFRAWSENKLLELPVMDWDRDYGRTPSSGRPLKKALRRADALNRIYHTNRAQPSHYVYFAEHHALWIPLIAAVARVIGAERDQDDSAPRFSWTKSQRRTMHTIIQTSRQIVALSEGSVIKERVLQQVKCLEVICNAPGEKHASERQSLGKRKLGQITNFTSGGLSDGSVQ